MSHFKILGFPVSRYLLPSFLVGGLLIALPFAEAAPKITVGSVPAYFSGKYGTSQTIDIFYLPTSIQYQSGRLRARLMFSYESVSGLPNGSTLTGGTLASRTSTSRTRTESGMGDTWMSLRYQLVKQRGEHLGFTPYFKIKFATASHSKGLGTGRNDYEAGVGLDGRLGAWAFPFAHIGYRVVGKPTKINLQNIAIYDAGISYVLPQVQSNIFTAMFSGSQSEQKGYQNPADLILAWNYNVTTQGSGFQVYVDKGLSDGSADYGIGIGGQIVF